MKGFVAQESKQGVTKIVIFVKMAEKLDNVQYLYTLLMEKCEMNCQEAVIRMFQHFFFCAPVLNLFCLFSELQEKNRAG